MSVLEAIILGAVQGLTEFLPVSSSGHLVLLHSLFINVHTESDLLFDVFLHLATLFALLIYFRKDILYLIKGCIGMGSSSDEEKKKARILSVVLIVATIPAGLIGFFLKDIIEISVRNNGIVAIALIVGSIILFFADYVEKRIAEKKELHIRNGLLIGLLQSCALIPGMSRSGMSIAGGFFVGLSRKESVRFAFLLAIPLVASAGILGIHDAMGSSTLAFDFSSLIIGSITAFIVGIGAIHFLLRFLRHHSLMPFIIYRVVLALIIFISLGI